MEFHCCLKNFRPKWSNLKKNVKSPSLIITTIKGRLKKRIAITTLTSKCSHLRSSCNILSGHTQPSGRELKLVPDFRHMHCKESSRWMNPSIISKVLSELLIFWQIDRILYLSPRRQSQQGTSANCKNCSYSKAKLPNKRNVVHYINVWSSIMKHVTACFIMRATIWPLFSSRVYQLSYSGFQSLVNYCGMCVCV